MSSNWTGADPGGAMLGATRAFVRGACHDTTLLAGIGECLAICTPGAAAWIAVSCGTAAEQGAPADLAGPAIFDLLRAWLPKLPRWNEEESESPPDPTPEQAALIELFQFVCQATVTHLARLPVHRESMGRDIPLLERLYELQGYSHGAAWVREALLKASGELVFLHPPSRKGLRVRYSNVSNNFHLFTLLQTAIGTRIEGGRTPDDVLARVARGRSSGQATDEAWWHYGTAHSNEARLDASICGEGLVREIPPVDGERIVLAWPPMLQSRSWDAGFLGPHLEAMPADAVIEAELTPDECERWLGRLEIRPAKAWWKFR